MQVQCTTKSQHQAMESRRVEAAEEEELRAVQRGGLQVRPLKHSQVFVVTQSGVSAPCSINRRHTERTGGGGRVSICPGFSSVLSKRRPLADIDAHCNNRNYSTTHQTAPNAQHLYAWLHEFRSQTCSLTPTSMTNHVILEPKLMITPPNISMGLRKTERSQWIWATPGAEMLKVALMKSNL